MARKKHKKLMKTNLYLGKHRKDLKLSWPQAKKKYPLMKAYHDSDFDGTLNIKDCRPLNPAMDGRLTEWVKKRLSKEKMKAAEKRLKRYNLVGKAMKKTEKLRKPKVVSKKAIIRKIIMKEGETIQRGPGRPAGVYKHTSPITGKKVPATEYYQHLKQRRRRMKETATQAQIREQAIMARRGVPPQITRIRQMRRMQVPQEIEEYEEGQIPIQTQQIPTQIPIKYRIVTDIMTGRRIIKSIPPQERWTMKGG